MNRKYIYLFSLGSKVVHSFETAASLRMRVAGKDSTDEDRNAVEHLIDSDMIGNFETLSTGEFVIQNQE